MSDPNVHWDGRQWLRWDGQEWTADPTIPPPKAKHTGLIIGSVAVVAVFALLLGVAGVWVFTHRDSPSPAAKATTTTITTVPIDGAQDSFTDPVGAGVQVTPKSSERPVSIAGGEPGLYGGTRNESACNRQQLIAYLSANPDKARAWAGVLGIQAAEIPSYVMKLTPMLLRSDTLVINHGYVNGVATSFPSVLQAGTAVLAGRRGLPVVRCYCGNPLTQPPAQIPEATYTGPTWPGWNPQSITVITQNTTLISIFIVVDVNTGESFTRPAGTAGGADSNGTQTPQPRPTQTYGGTTDEQVGDVTGFLNALANGDYASADSYTTSNFRARFGSAGNLAPGNWGALTSYEITGAYVGDSFVAVYVDEYWEGGYRQSTYYVTKGGGTYIDDADFNDSDTSEPNEYPSDYPEQYPDNGATPQEDYPSDYPEQYPDNGATPEEDYPSDYPEQYPDNGDTSQDAPADGAVG